MSSRDMHYKLPLPPSPAGFLSAFVQSGAHDLGPMNKECRFCRARHWLEEASPPQSHELYESCCKKGEVDLPPLEPVPNYLRALMRLSRTGVKS
jgi:hypothetical protein